MLLEPLKAARKRSIGTKQTAKAIEKGNTRTIFVAKDAEEHVTRELVKLARDWGLEVVYADSMLALGKACGIEVGAAAAAVLDAWPGLLTNFIG